MADLATLGYKIDSRDAVTASRNLDRMSDSATKATRSQELLSEAKDVGRRAGIALAASIAGVSSALAMMTRKGLASVDSQAKLTRSLGATIDGVRAVQLAASEGGLDAMDQSLSRLHRRLGAAASGNKVYAESIAALGINISDVINLDADARIAAIADAVRDFGGSNAEAARHLQMLGFQQAEAVQFFREGGDAIRAARDAVDSYGVSLSAVDAAQVEAANDAWGRTSLILEGVQNRLAVEFAPVLLYISELLTNAHQEAGGFANAVADGMDTVVRGAAFAADAIEGLRRVVVLTGQGIAVMVLGFQSGMWEAADAVIMGPINAVNALIRQINALGRFIGVAFAEIEAPQIAKGIREEIRTSRRAVEIGVADMQKTLMAPMPSVGILSGLDKARKASREAAEQIVSDREKEGKAFKGIVKPAGDSAAAIAANEAAAKAAQKEADALASAFHTLRRRLDPARAAAEDHADAVRALNFALSEGIINGIEYNFLMAELAKGAEDVAVKTREAANEVSPFVLAWMNGLRRIDDAFANVWKGAFDSFKSFRRSLGDAFRQLLGEMAHMAATRPIMLSLGAALGGAPGAASAAGFGGIMDLANIGSSALGLIKGGFGASGLASSFAMSGVGQSLGLSAQMGGTGMGFLTSAGSTFTAGAGLLGAGAAGILGGSLLAGDKQIAGMGGTITSAGGAAIGAALGGPVGAAVGGVLGGAVNALFGRGPMRQRATTLAGVVGAEGFEEGALRTDFRAKGGLFRSDRRDFAAVDVVTQELALSNRRVADFGDSLTAVAAQIIDVFNETASGVSAGLRAVAADMDLSTDGLAAFRHELRLVSENGKMLTDEQIAEEIAIIADGLARSLIPELDDFAKRGETAAQTVTRLHAEFSLMTHAMALLGKSAEESRQIVIDMGLDLRSSLIDTALEVFGTAEAMSGALIRFEEVFHTEAERTQRAMAAIGSVFDDLGESVPSSIDAYRALVESQDATTEAGMRTYATLLKLAPAFADVRDSIEHQLRGIYESITGVEASSEHVSWALDNLADGTYTLAEMLAIAENAALDFNHAMEMQTAAAEAAAVAQRDQAEAMALAQREQAEAVARAQQIARERSGLEIRLLGLLGDTAEIRRRELEIIDPSNRTIQLRIWQLEDEAAAINTANRAADELIISLRSSVSAAMDAARSAAAENIDMIRAESDARISASQEALAAAKDSLSAIRSEHSKIARARVSLAGEIGDLSGMRRASAVDALRRGVGTGDVSGIGDAAEIAAKIEERDYTSSGQFKVEQARTLYLLARAEDLAENQIDHAEAAVIRLEESIEAIKLASKRQIDAIEDALRSELIRLDNIVENAQAQLNQQIGIRNGVLSVDASVRATNSAIRDLGRLIASASESSTIPQFANGASHMGGLRIVGERGPELEATGPSRIMSNEKLMSAISSSGELANEIRALRSENMAALRAIEKNTREIMQIERRWDRIGLPEQREIA